MWYWMQICFNKWQQGDKQMVSFQNIVDVYEKMIYFLNYWFKNQNKIIVNIKFKRQTVCCSWNEHLIFV